MPYRIDFDPSHRWAILAIDHAPQSEEEMREIARALITRPGFGRGMGLLLDVRAVAKAPSFDESNQLARIFADPRLLRDHPVALLVSGTMHYGVANQISTLTALEGGLLQGFTDEGAARHWLERHTTGRHERPGPP